MGSATTQRLARTRGVLTGASSSGLLAKICLEDSFLAALPEMKPMGFELEPSCVLVGMSWSDNVFTFSSEVDKACRMMYIWGGYLTRLCGLRFKPGSYEVISASHRAYVDAEFVRDYVTWRHVSSLVSLGQSWSCTGSQAEDRKRLRRSWEACFWRNARVLTCRKINLQSRLNFWRLLSCGIGSFRFAMWTPSCGSAKLVDGWHNLILHRIVRVQYEQGEEPDRFCRRRNRIVSTMRDKLNLRITPQWAMCLVRWLEHLQRHPESPGSMLLEVQDDLWVQTLRALNVKSASFDNVLSGRTNTRSGPGKPIRWAESWVQALKVASGIANPMRDKALTRERAQLVTTMLDHGRVHGKELAL